MIVIKSRVVKSEYNTRSRLCGEFPFNIRYLGIEVIEHIAVTYITAKWNKFLSSTYKCNFLGADNKQ